MKIKKHILYILTFFMICSCNTSVNSTSSSSISINENDLKLNRLVEYINETLIPAYRTPNISSTEEQVVIYYWDNFLPSVITKNIITIDEDNNFYQGKQTFYYDEKNNELNGEYYYGLTYINKKIFKSIYALPSEYTLKQQSILSDEEFLKHQNSCNNVKNNRLKEALSQFFVLNEGEIIEKESLNKKGKICFLKETPEMIEFIIDFDEYIVERYSALSEYTSNSWFVNVLEYTHGFINKKTLSFEFIKKIFEKTEEITRAETYEYRGTLNCAIYEPENIEDFEVVEKLN